jgi:Fe-Mn family superoxide dismutase
MIPRDEGQLSRRAMLKTIGAGGALLGLGVLSAKNVFGETPSPAVPPGRTSAAPGLVQPFTLPTLGYAYDALEPHIDARTMEIHHQKHHQAYITNANKALADYPDLHGLSAEDILGRLSDLPEKVRTVLRNNVGGHWNHTFFWRVIAPKAGGVPQGELAKAITSEFGSIDQFKTRFAEAAMKQFGSGWAWLTFSGGKLKVQSTANQDSPISNHEIPVLGLDVWEHAYYLHYQNRRADYVAAFWNVIDWEHAEAVYTMAHNASV